MLYFFVQNITQTHSFLWVACVCPCVCDDFQKIPFVLVNLTELLSKENYGSRGNSSVFFLFLSLSVALSRTRLDVYFQLTRCKIDISIWCQLKWIRLPTFRSGVYLLLALHRFSWMTYTISDYMWFFFLRQHFGFLSIAFQRKKTAKDGFSTVPGYIFCVSFSGDFINIKSKFSTWITHSHFD